MLKCERALLISEAYRKLVNDPIAYHWPAITMTDDYELTRSIAQRKGIHGQT